MTNRFGLLLDARDARWATAEGVSETIIAAVLLLHEKSVDEVAAKLRPGELAHVVRFVSRCPTCYPSGTLAALRSLTPTPQPPSVSTSTHQPTSPLAARIIAENLHRYRPNARKSAGRPFEHPQSTATPAKPTYTEPGTLPGTLAETVRRRFAVADLTKLGLSVRAISAGTGIPRSSVHRAMRAIARGRKRRSRLR
jgi:hypothetical protein